MAQTLNINPELKIRAATSADISALLSIDRKTASSAHWSAQQYEELLSPESRRLVLVAECATGGSVAGFLVAKHIGPDWELENMVVQESEQRKGIGGQLLAFLISKARQTNGEAVFLEVRESNLAARTLYRRAGFQQTGRRKAYYQDPAEDAFLYRLDL